MDSVNGTQRFIDSLPADRQVHALAVRAAKRLGHLMLLFIPAGSLADAEREFYRIVREALEELSSEGAA